jgi:hypothetical protein
MKSDDAAHQRIARLSFPVVYRLYLAKVERKGRTKDELDQVLTWLTGLDAGQLARLQEEDATFGRLFDEARLNPRAGLITGVICGVRVEEIADPLTQKVRYLDKLVDELAKGRKMEKVLR